ncbi:MAG: T9SS type A sorting domain-containing protein [Chitinophagales bacterium]|nr:T9SS type A sorting domain-containing protein [Chitinophagales bacterium]
MKKFLLTSGIAIIVSLSFSQTVNWAEHIAPILYKNCTTCHHDGGAGHFSLINYSDAFNNAFSIHYKTQAKKMPPFPSDPTYRKFKDERRLTDSEIQLITDWFNNGAPMGDSTLAPAKPTYTNLPEIVTPSKVLQMPTYTVTATNDVYQCFVLDPQLTQDVFLDAYEVIPGNREIVHHVLIYEDTTGQSTVKDAQTQEPGYTSFGGIGVMSARLLGGWVPGSNASFFPRNMGVKLHKNGKIVIQVHYPAGSKNKADSTTLRLRFSNSTLREINIDPALHYFGGNGGLTNGPLVINAGEVKTFYNKYDIPSYYPKLSLIYLAPHMHLIGRSIMAFAVTPTNDTIPLVKIPNWDFRWQMFYFNQKPVVVPPGSKLMGKATYDNTATSPFQPNDPPKKVTAGEATTDEMFLVYFGYTLYENGDENIVIDSSIIQQPTGINTNDLEEIITTAQFLDPLPNPAQNQTKLQFVLPKQETILFQVFDVNGKIVSEIKPVSYEKGFGETTLNTEKFSSGNYIIRMVSNSGKTVSKQLLVEH